MLAAFRRVSALRPMMARFEGTFEGVSKVGSPRQNFCGAPPVVWQSTAAAARQRTSTNVCSSAEKGGVQPVAVCCSSGWLGTGCRLVVCGLASPHAPGSCRRPSAANLTPAKEVQDWSWLWELLRAGGRTCTRALARLLLGHESFDNLFLLCSRLLSPRPRPLCPRFRVCAATGHSDDRRGLRAWPRHVRVVAHVAHGREGQVRQVLRHPALQHRGAVRGVDGRLLGRRRREPLSFPQRAAAESSVVCVAGRERRRHDAWR